MSLWRAGCGESCTSGSEGGPGKPTSREAGRAPRSDPHTYIPLRKGFLYLAAVIDFYSRHVLSWKLSNSLDTEFCLEALEMALGSGRKPRVFHSDQGCQFTSTNFVERLRKDKIKISWSGRKRCFDNILVERLWRTIKYVAAGFSAKPSGGVSQSL